MKFFLIALWGVVAADRFEVGANPIRRVVTMLQKMKEKVEQEGEKEEELMEKFECYCKKNTGALTKSIATAQQKLAQLTAQIEADTAAKAQIDEELAQHKQDRADAESTLQQATKMRSKERSQYENESGMQGQNVEALKKAIAAIASGLSGGFLQAKGATVVQRMVLASAKLSQWDRQAVLSFLANDAKAPGSSEIVGILKEMKDEMERDLGDMVSQEEQAQRSYEELQSAKRKEIAAATQAIEEKTQRSGQLAVSIVEGKDDKDDTMASLSNDEQFQVNLRTNCTTKQKEWGERKIVRSQELLAIAETIKILNDDDALDLFKKTLPGPGKSFLQTRVATKQWRRAQNIINGLAQTVHSTAVDFIAMALKGKKVDFTKVIVMIDNLVVTLGKEQKADDAHREYCNKEFDTSDDRKGSVQRNLEAQTHAKEQAETASANLAAEIAALQESIADLDKSVLEATEQRKNEHSEFVQTLAENQAAVDLIEFAKNRLQKFYNPKLYKPPPEREMSEEERVYSNLGGELEPTPAPGGIAGTGVAVFLQAQGAVAPAPPPETFGAYKTKGSENSGVMAMMDMLTNDVKKDMQTAQLEEKDAQEEYEQLMTDSQKKRASDSKLVNTKETAKADADVSANAASEALTQANEELKATQEYIGDLHKNCDFLLENYDFRKTARAQEVDALKQAKAVLNGADFALF